MKKVLLTLAVAASMVASASADVFDSATWYSGDGWSSAKPMTNNTASSLMYVFGVFENAESVTMPDYFDYPDASKKIHIEYPGGKTIDKYPTAINASVPNGFKFNIGDTFGTSTPGTYYVTIPAGCMKIDGAENPEALLEFYIEDNRVYTPEDINFSASPDPLFKQSSIMGVRLTYDINYSDGTRKYTAATPNQTIFPYFESADGTKVMATAKNVGSTTGTGGVEITAEKLITTPGVWTLVVPQDVIRLNKQGANGSSSVSLVCNKELRYVYTIVNENNYATTTLKPVITPTPGEVTSLTQIQFETPSDDVEMYLPTEGLLIEVSYPDGKKYNIRPYTNDNVAGFIAYLQLGETTLNPDKSVMYGTYKFVVPQGCFEFLMNDTYYVNEEFTFEYELKESIARDFEYTVAPTDGTAFYSFDYITLTFKDTDLYYNYGSKATLTYPSGKTVECTLSWGQQNSRMIVDPGYPNEFGEYTIEIPGNLLVDENYYVNNPITLHYTLLERLPAKVEFTISPKEGEVEALEFFTLAAPSDVTNLKVPGGVGTQKLYFRNAEGEETVQWLKETNNATSYRVILEQGEIRGVEGDYALIVPEGTFIVTLSDGSQCYNEAMVFTWTMTGSGISGVNCEAGAISVYTLDGVKVADDAETLKALKGVYVVNGKKVIVK